MKPSRVMYAGLDAWTTVEDEVINKLRLRRAGMNSLADSSSPVLDWIASEAITHLAIHFDVDVLEPKKFGPVLFNEPNAPTDALAGVPRGRMAPIARRRIVGTQVTMYESVQFARLPPGCVAALCLGERVLIRHLIKSGLNGDVS